MSKDLDKKKELFLIDQSHWLATHYVLLIDQSQKLLKFQYFYTLSLKLTKPSSLNPTL